MTEQSSRFGSAKRTKILAVILVIVLVGSMLTGFIVFYAGGDNSAVAIVNGEKITRDQLYEAMYAQTGQQTLDQLINERLILAEGRRLEISVTDEQLDEELQKIIDEQFFGRRDYFEQTLSQYGMTEKELKEDLYVQVLAQNIILNEHEPTEEELREYLDSNRSQFNISEQVRARHILLETEEEAEKVRGMLESGADFAELVKEYSKDTASVESGGDVGFIEPGQMDPAFEEAAYSLEVGELGPVVKTFYGFHVLEVTERKPGREVDYDEARDDVKKVVEENILRREMSGWLNELREAAQITYR